MDAFYSQTKPRIQEYCGLRSEESPGLDCEFLVARGAGEAPFRFTGNQDLDAILEGGDDIYRSLWSRRSSLFFLDLEFKNTQDPREIYRNGPDLFRRTLEPIYQELCGLLAACGLSFLSVITATGYHCVFAVPFETGEHARLESLGRPCQELMEQYARVPQVSHRSRPVPHSTALAFDGLGRLAEFLAKTIRPAADVPVAAGIQHPRQVLLDLSTFADPLHLRFIRCVGSYHQKSGQPYATLIRREANGVEHPLEDLLSVYGWPLRAAKRICSTPARIPSAGHGLQDLMDQYLASELRRRHTAFDLSQPSSGDLENARKLLQGFQDHELAEDRGLKRAVQLGRCKGLHSRSIGMAVAERYRQAAWDSPIMAWHTESHDGYNPTSRALFWSRLYAS